MAAILNVERISFKWSGLVVVFLDDFKDVSVWIAKEEAIKRCFAYWVNQRCAVCLQPCFELWKAGQVGRNSNVPAKLFLKSRRLELWIFD